MRRYPVALLTLILLTASVWAQDANPADGADESISPAEDTSTEVDESADAEELDDPTLDEQGYDNAEEDDFRPSEEVQSDKSITFPTDI